MKSSACSAVLTIMLSNSLVAIPASVAVYANARGRMYSGVKFVVVCQNEAPAAVHAPPEPPFAGLYGERLSVQPLT